MLTLDSAIVNCVKCLACGKLHETGRNTYLAFAGNVYLGGVENGLIGDNLDEDGKVKSVTTYCQNVECLDILFKIQWDGKEKESLGDQLRNLRVNDKGFRPQSTTYGPVIGVGPNQGLTDWEGLPNANT